MNGMGQETFLTLSELCDAVQDALEGGLPFAFWVMAEVASVGNRGRYVFLDLAEQEDGQIVAQMPAVVWEREIVDEFEEQTGESLRRGMKVLIRGRVRFHGRYGLKLHVEALDARFTLGEIAVRKREALARLDREGLLDLNRSIRFPLAPQRIALISSASAAGCQDFLHQLDCNPEGFRFAPVLFEATLQGDGAPKSIVRALARIGRPDPSSFMPHPASPFDVVVLVRGGGANMDLACFDDYSLAAAIARCPLPVITGIGHQRDETVADRVAHASAKTPTAVAELLLDRVREFDDRMERLGRRMAACAGSAIRLHGARLESLRARLGGAIRSRIVRESNRLDGLERAVGLLDPMHTLRRGFSITYYDGRPVTRASAVPDGGSLRTVVAAGEIESIATGVGDPA